MDEDEDTVMSDSHTLPALPSNPSLTQTLPTHLTHQPIPTLTPSFIPQVPASPSPGSDLSQPRGSGMAPPDRLAKASDTGSSSADQFLKRDSLVESNSDWSDEEDTAKAGLPLASLATGLCYDHRMRYHCEVNPQSDVHPEDPRRIYYIYKELCRAGLVDDDESSRPLAPKTLERIAARDATEEEITLVHTDAHYAFVQSTKGMYWPLTDFSLTFPDLTLEMPNEELINLEKSRDSIYFNKLTFASALLSAGGAIETCMAVAQRQVKNAIAVIRPPGHHAEDDAAMGFCLFNNVSVAARVCQNKLGDACRKIMILDWLVP
jgi:histone deacetylase 6